MKVDNEIADIIKLLNEKGYKTIASCAGHSEIKYDAEQKAPLEYLEKFKDGIKVISQDNEYFYYYPEILGSTTYIKFDKDYNFSSLPIGFKKDNDVISKKIEFYNNDSHKRRSKQDIEDELKENWSSLLIWAQKLENRKLKGRKENE